MRLERKGRLAARPRRSFAALPTWARSGCSVSLVISPRQTRVQIASTVSCGKPPPAASCSALKKRAPRRSQRVEDGPCARRQILEGGRLDHAPPERGDVIGEEEGDPPVPLAERFDAGPDDLACGDERVEVRRLVPLEPGRQDLALENRGGQRQPLQRLDHVEQGVEAAPRARHALPLREQAAQHRQLDGLDLVPELGERSPPDRGQDGPLAPLLVPAAGAELSLEQASLRVQRPEGEFGGRSAQPEPGRQLVGGERAVRAGVARDEIAQGLRPGLEQRLRQALAAAARRVHRDSARRLRRRPAAARRRRGARRHDACAPVRRPRLQGRRRSRVPALPAPTGRRGAAAGRARRRPCAPGSRRAGTATAPRARRARRRRAARAVPRPRAAPAAATGRSSAPGPVARPAAHRRRTGNWRRSRTAATRRTARASACRPCTTRTCRDCTPRSVSTSAGMSNTSRRHSR